MQIFESKALGWLLKLLAETPPSKMNTYPEVGQGENVIETATGPLMASESIRRLEGVLSLYESGMIEAHEWFDPIHQEKVVLIRTLVSLEMSMTPEIRQQIEMEREISFRKGGVIVWRDKLKKPKSDMFAGAQAARDACAGEPKIGSAN